MSTPKQHQINTVQDMIDCTNEDNLGDFIQDLTTLLQAAHACRKLPNFNNKACIGGFTWIDDGMHRMKLEVTT